MDRGGREDRGADGADATAEDRPFHLSGLAAARLPVLVAVPHAGRTYPKDLLARMRQPEAAALRLEDRLVDRLGRIVAQRTGAALLVADTPRAMLDLNRAPADIDWSMIAEPRDGAAKSAGPRNSLANRRARGGLGLIPRRLSGMGEIWRGPLPAEELERRIAAIHTPYHAALDDALHRLHGRWGAALLIDLHSMPPLAGRAKGAKGADFVVGDRFGASCNGMISAAAIAHLGRADRTVAHNRPYAGGYVLDRHGRPAQGVHAVQIEVCRSLYLDRELHQESARLPAIGRLLSGLVMELADLVTGLGHAPDLPQAAE